MKKTTYALYILAAIIVLVSARYVQVQISARRGGQEILHQVHIATNTVYYTNTDLIATIQVNDLEGQELEANLKIFLRQAAPIEEDQENQESQEYLDFITPVAFETDAYGHAMITIPLPYMESGFYHLVVSVESELGQEYFTKGIRISADTGQNFVINFDKGLYNPGDTVLFRILALQGASARPLSGEEFTISIFDGNDNRVFVENTNASDFGIISGRFALASEVNSGLYRLTVEQNGRVVAQEAFEVSPFVLPRFRVDLQTDKNEYRLGDTIYLTGTAMYFFGEPVSQGTVTIYVNENRIAHEIPLNEDGTFAIEYDATSTGLYSIWVEVIDNSNYRMEAATTVRATEGAFEIEVMPEHGYLVQGMSNRIYIFTHTADGAPVRAFMQISGRGFSRQVATDNNGIGVFILEDVEAQNHIHINAVDMDGESVQGDFTFAGVSRNVTLSTCRPRYAMNDIITLYLNRREQDGTFKIFAYKNDRLLKLIETDHDRAEIKLDNVFGLIDIYAVWLPPGSSGQTQHLPHARRTIFIDPGNYMRLTVESDAPEYEPGEFVSLNFNIQDSNGQPLDAALLVSIVDEAMLNLAANDLSIDNIRLALEDIRFGQDLDAATLYASLIAGASEQAITRLLLRQGNVTPFFQTGRIVNEIPPLTREDHVANTRRGAFNALRIAVVLFAAAAFFVLRTENKPVPKPIKHAPNSPEAFGPDETEKGTSRGKRGVTIIVALTLIVFLFTLFFLSSCGGRDDDGGFENGVSELADGPVMNWDNGAAWGDEAQADSAPGSQATPDDTRGLADLPTLHAPDTMPPTLAPAPDTAQPEPSLPTEDAPASDEPNITADEPAAPTEIETQTARVRRLFLETMLFVPELIARDGHADLQFMLADNITTWNIQVVGNTMDGIIGHTQSSIRAFQPFFVDFELPRNSIRGDVVSIPVTVFNYTDYSQTVILTIADLDWFTLHGEAVQTLTVPSNRSVMVYVPVTITDFGDFVFRAYADALGFADAAERAISVNPEGFRIRRVVSSGSIESSTWQHLLFMQDNLPDTRNAFITFYPSVMSQVIDGMENIFRMPFGCFEQTSSILYPNILALRYMQQNNLDNREITERALRYISSGYQQLLTFEVGRGSGGFSLFGRAPAETVLTAYGLMQLKDLATVYTIDERVLDRMTDFLFSHQNRDGSFEITGRGRITDSQRLAFNAYIIWALSEAVPNDNRLAVSVEYLLSRLNVVDDNYTLALIANVLVNTGHSRATEIVNRLVANVTVLGETAYVSSTTRDYFGAFGRIQYLQTTALTSIALSAHGSHQDTNNRLINYIISRRDTWGTWHSTQATILSLKALTRHADPEPLKDGRITVTIGGQQRVIEISGENTLSFYQISFSELAQENIIEIDFPDLGRMTYSIVQEFFAPYDSVELDRGFELSSQMNSEFAVHELAHQEIRIINTSGDIVKNGLVAVSIPQGFRVERSSLAVLVHAGIIERYEMRHDNINLYLRDTEPGEIIDLLITYRPAFPVVVTGGHVRVFDYYNPMVEGFLMPMGITVR